MTFEEALQKLQTASPLHITVSGDIGAGKSTFAKRLAKELALPRISIGSLMREEAAKRGITLTEFGKLQEQDDTVDRAMDALQQKRSKETERGVFEGRVAWNFVVDPKIRVFLKVDEKTAAERIIEDTNEERDELPSVEAVIADNEKRKRSEQTRYRNYYDIDAYDPGNFDIILDTSKIDAQEVFKEGVKRIAEAI